MPNLRVNQAVVLPVTPEAGPHLQKVTICRRLTPHVRHRQKYVDVPVPGSRAFVFRADHRTRTVRARTLRRGDFSRWIADVFSDHALARALQGHEHRYMQSVSDEPLTRIAAAINSHYELTGESDAADT